MTTPVAARPDSTPGSLHATRWVFIVASFLGSGLLFLVQPMVARLLLPVAGGSSALWSTSMVFFQVVLLAAYLFAHLGATRLRPRIHTRVQVALLVSPLLFVLPVSLPDGWVLPESANISLWALGTLVVVVGLPFFAVSTASPTLQRWFSLTGHPDAEDPYFLYAAGNVGAVLALVAYPLAVEPLLTLSQQAWLWTALYAAFVAAAIGAGSRVVGRAPGHDGGAAPAAGAGLGDRLPGAGRQRLTWVAQAAVPSALLLGVTNFLTTDLASFPLLWILPLLAYLLSFVLAFGADPVRLVERIRPIVLIGLIPVCVSVYIGLRWLLVSIVVQLAWFFAAAILCHGRLAAGRPEAGRLTEFYLSISIGGAIGGTLTVLVAPLVFPTVMEYPIAIALVLLIAPFGRDRPMLTRLTLPWITTPLAVGGAGLAALVAPAVFGPVLAVALVAAMATLNTHRAMAVGLAGLLLAPQVVNRSDDLYTERTAFGVYGVADGEGFRTLSVGTTIHGSQELGGTDLRPTTYYHPSGPLGQIFERVPEEATVAVVGLGIGTVAAYGRSGDAYHFYEIDPKVVEIAENDELFGFLAQTPASVDIEVVDGRLGVARAEERFDVLILDAFSSDAIPVHLMTVEAVRIYLERLTPGGVAAFHISNRHFDLEPVLGRIAAEEGVAGAIRLFAPGADDIRTGATASRWVILSPSPEVVEAIAAADDNWRPLADDGGLWTDDYSFVLGALDL